jgi:hypothetical protein
MAAAGYSRSGYSRAIHCESSSARTSASSFGGMDSFHPLKM